MTTFMTATACIIVTVFDMGCGIKVYQFKFIEKKPTYSSKKTSHFFEVFDLSGP